jgi:hypothetical protein
MKTNSRDPLIKNRNFNWFVGMNRPEILKQCIEYDHDKIYVLV